METINRFSDLAGTSRVATTTYTYDADNRVSNILNKDGSNNNISSLTYTYDAGSRVQTEVIDGTTKTFTYDTTDQLTADGSTTVTYDGTGNRNNGSYTTGTGNRMSGDGTWTYTYDDEGNQTKKSKGASLETWNYGYDNENHLTSVEKHATDGGTLLQKTEFVYNALGLRVQKRVDTDGNGTWDTTERYAWDGWNPGKPGPIGTENWDVWADLDGSSSLTTRYLRGDVVDQLLARTDAGTAYWELGDRLGSIRTVLDNSAVIKDTVTYDGWGNATHTNSNFAGRYLWTGREWDSEIGLQYNRARFYDPASGRWISQDPLGFDAGDSNLYRYVNNAAITDRDPSGLETRAEMEARLKQFQAQVTQMVKFMEQMHKNGMGITAQQLQQAQKAAATGMQTQIANAQKNFAIQQLQSKPVTVTFGKAKHQVNPSTFVFGKIPNATGLALHLTTLMRAEANNQFLVQPVIEIKLQLAANILFTVTATEVLTQETSGAQPLDAIKAGINVFQKGVNAVWPKN